MSSCIHPTRGTRIHPKGLQSPLEGPASAGRQEQIRLRLQEEMLDILPEVPLLFEHGSETYCSNSVADVICELLPLLVLRGKAIRTPKIYRNWVMRNTILCG